MRMIPDDFEPEEWERMVDRFADPGGESALYPETADNPRNKACGSCGKPNRLTRLDKLKGYQCDQCADRAEGKPFGIGEY